MALTSTSTFSGSVVRTSSGMKDHRRYVFRGHQGSIISAASVSLFAAPFAASPEGSATGSNKWSFVLSSGVYRDLKRTRRTASARFEGAMQSAFQENIFNTTAVRGPFSGGPVTSIRAFAVANEMCRGGSCFREFVSDLVAWYAIATVDPDEVGGTFLLSSR